MCVDVLCKLCGMLCIPKYKAQQGFACLKLIAYAKCIDSNPDLNGTNENKKQNTKFCCLMPFFTMTTLMPFENSMINECDWNWMKEKPAKTFFN